MRGDFVLLLWDAERGEGLIARDQLGMRPLLSARQGRRRCFFASEIRDLLALLPRRPAPDPTSVAHWLVAAQPPGDAHAATTGIRRLPPAAMLLLDRRACGEARYWRPRFQEPLDWRPEQVSARSARCARARR